MVVGTNKPQTTRGPTGKRKVFGEGHNKTRGVVGVV
jgi:hypothetical protein